MLLLLTGCTLHQKSTLGKTEITQKVDRLMDEVYKFAVKSEAYALENGRALTILELKYAKTIGIKHPEKVRVFYTADLPVPTNIEVLKGFKELGYDSVFVAGVTYRYGIFIKKNWFINMLTNKNSILAHELVHVRQVEESTNYKNFIKIYLIQAFSNEYFAIPYEHQAYKETENFKGFNK